MEGKNTGQGLNSQVAQLQSIHYTSVFNIWKNYRMFDPVIPYWIMSLLESGKSLCNMIAKQLPGLRVEMFF